MKRLLFIAALLLLTHSLLADDPTSQPASIKTDFRRLLSTNGAQFSLNFTIEYEQPDLDKPPTFSPNQSRTITLPATFKDADDFLNQLRIGLPDVDITRDDALPNVVHLREKTLLNRRNYFLDKKTDFLYQATLGECLAEIIRQSDWTFEEDNLYFTPIIVKYDPRVSTQISLKNASYRTILSAAILRPDAPVILWTSRTIRKEGRLVTIFRLASLKLPDADKAPDPAPAEIAAAMRDRQAAQHAIDLAAANLVSAPSAAVITETSSWLVDRTSTDTLTLRIPLRNIPAQTLLTDLQPLLAPETKSGALKSPNSLILRDASARLNRYLQIIASLEEAAGIQRAAAVAKGADPQGLAWTKNIIPINEPAAPPPSAPADRFLAPIYSGADPAQVETSDRLITQIIPLAHITASSAAAELQKAAPATIIAPSDTANCLILSGQAAQIHQLMLTLEKLDK